MIAIDKGWQVGVMTGILTVVIIVFGEVLPKTIAATFADRMAYIVAPTISALVILLTPLTILLAFFHEHLHKDHFKRCREGGNVDEGRAPFHGRYRFDGRDI